MAPIPDIPGYYRPPAPPPPAFPQFMIPPNFGAQMAGAGPAAQSAAQGAQLAASLTPQVQQYANQAMQQAAAMQSMGGAPGLDALPKPPAPGTPTAGGMLGRGVARWGPWAIPAIGYQISQMPDKPGPEKFLGVKSGDTRGALQQWLDIDPFGLKPKDISEGIGQIAQQARSQQAQGGGTRARAGGSLETGVSWSATVAPKDRVLDALNAAVKAVGDAPDIRKAIFSQINLAIENGASDEEVIALAQSMMEQLPNMVAQVKAEEVYAEELADAERAYNEHFSKMEERRQAALTSAIGDLESRQWRANQNADARAMALQKWAQGMIQGFGQGSSGPTQTAQESVSLLPASMQETGQQIINQPYAANQANAGAMQNQLATLAQFSPTLNPQLNPNYGQPYTDAIAALVAQRANVPMYEPFQPPEQDPYAAMYAEAAMLQAQAAWQNAINNTGGGQGQMSPEAAELFAELGKSQ